MRRFAVAALLLLGTSALITGTPVQAKPPEGAAAKPKTDLLKNAPKWAIDDPDVKSALETGDLDLGQWINDELRAHNSAPATLLAAKDFRKTLQDNLNNKKLNKPLKLEIFGPTKDAAIKAKAARDAANGTAKAPVRKAVANSGIIADDPMPADTTVQPKPQNAPRKAPPEGRVQKRSPVETTDDKCRPGKDCETEAEAPCISCLNELQPAPVLSPENEDNIRDVADAIVPTTPAPALDYHPSSLGDDGGGCGFLGCISSSNLMWGVGGALLGGVLGYMVGKNHRSAPNYNDMYAQYGGYAGWRGSGYPGSFGTLPGAYRLPGTYGYGAPPILPFPGPPVMGGGPISGLYGNPYGGGMGMGGYGSPYGSSYGGGGMGYGMSPGVGGYYGVNGAYNYAGGGANVLCPNCTLPAMYPLTGNGGILPYR